MLKKMCSSTLKTMPSFGWVDQNDVWISDGNDSLARAQDSYGPDCIYPFLWFDNADFHANTDYSDWATLSITWDFENGYAYAYYDGTLITVLPPLIQPSRSHKK